MKKVVAAAALMCALVVPVFLSGCGGGGGGSQDNGGGGGTPIGGTPVGGTPPRVAHPGCTEETEQVASAYGAHTDTTGDPGFDAILNDVVNTQVRFFGLTMIRHHILEEYDQPNAFSMRKTPDIYLGKKLLNETIRNYGPYATAGIVAHEMAHQVQRQEFPEVFVEDHVVCRELEADSFAGYYLGAHEGLTEDNARTFFQKLRDLPTKDDWTRSDWHGTPDMREASGAFGFYVAKVAAEEGWNPTNRELHSAFYTFIHEDLVSACPTRMKTTKLVSTPLVEKALKQFRSQIRSK